MKTNAHVSQPEAADTAVRFARAPRWAVWLKQCRTAVRSPAIKALCALIIAAIVAVWFFALRQIDLDRELALRAEIDKNSNLVLAHSERASRSIQVLDQVLLAIRKDYLRHGAPPDLADLVNALWTDTEYAGLVSLIDERGDIIASTARNTFNYSDRDYFKHHQTNAEDRVLVGKPIQSRVNGNWIVSLTRRITKADGSFGGVAFLSLSPLFFAAEYEHVVQGPFGSMALIGLDGVTRARRNADKVSFGDNASKSQLFKELPKSPEGYYIAVAASDGVKRLVAYRSLEGYPLVAVVASSYDDVLSSTSERGRLYGAGALGISLVILFAGLAAVSYLIKRRRVEAAIRASEQRYRQLFEDSLDAVISAAPDGRILSANPAARVMFRLEAGAEVAISRSQLLDASDLRVNDLLHHEATGGSFVGAVRMVRADGDTFEAEISSTVNLDQGGLTSMIVRDVSERKLAEDQIRELAFYDHLTKLPNRRLLMDRLQVAMASNHRQGRQGALLFIDLDNFKVLNDTLGHKKGDELLQQVALRLMGCLREGDTCARFGGDEFVVMLVDLSGAELEAAQQARSAALKVLHTLGAPYALDGIEHHTTPSIGVTLFSGSEATLEAPLMRADLAMYQAKSAGRNTLRFYDPQIQATMAQRATLEKDLREALRAQHFTLYYQPQIHGASDVRGVEALIRWQHPQKGLVSPADFIPLAEETGLIVPMGQWVLEQACQQLASWASHPHFKHLHLAVNVSERQFRQGDFVSQVLGVLERTGANPTLLRLEITEGLLIADVDEVVKKIGALKASGVGFELDDFGTGYSSLTYLKQLPLDRLKIDKSFVRDVLTDPNDAAIAKMVIVLAESLGLSVIAEGVETDQQREFLQNHGCHDYQGFLFSRPVPVAELEGWILARQAGPAHPT